MLAKDNDLTKFVVEGFKLGGQDTVQHYLELYFGEQWISPQQQYEILLGLLTPEQSKEALRYLLTEKGQTEVSIFQLMDAFCKELAKVTR